MARGRDDSAFSKKLAANTAAGQPRDSGQKGQPALKRRKADSSASRGQQAQIVAAAGVGTAWQDEEEDAKPDVSEDEHGDQDFLLRSENGSYLECDCLGESYLA